MDSMVFVIPIAVVALILALVLTICVVELGLPPASFSFFAFSAASLSYAGLTAEQNGFTK